MRPTRPATPVSPTAGFWVGSGGARLWLVGCWLIAALASGCSENTVDGTMVNADGSGGFGDSAALEDSGGLFGSDTLTLELPPKDTGPVQGEFGWPCTEAEECNTGLCIESPLTTTGKMCTKFCGTCPTGYQCVEEVIPGTSDKGYYCAPKFKFLCDPCDDNLGCNSDGKAGNVCLQYGTGGNSGSFCGAACSEIKPDCPDGFTCEPNIDKDTGLNTYQCRRDGLCECSSNAKLLGLKTSCTNKNIYGTCKGFRQCTADGLTACNATVAKPEECNGLDDDCNGKTDDFQAGATCDLKNEFGTCKGQIKECVDGQAVCDGKKPAPEACNGVDDNCNGDTDEGLCEDGDPCTKDSCNTDGSCKHIQLGGLVCDDGSLCTQVDKCVSGKCMGGSELDCNDKDPCTSDSCNPIDGCKHAPASEGICPDDGIQCTQDLCQNGKCSHPQASDGTKCAEDGKPCTADICTAGKCEHPLTDGQTCTDDGKPCTTDVCVGGICKHNPASSIPCDDGNICTQNDNCLNGTCKPGLVNQCNDGAPCTKDSCVPGTGCVHSVEGGNGLPCPASSAACPVGVCSGGACYSKPSVPCTYAYDPGLCGDEMDLPGTCNSGGKCTVTKDAIPGKVTCTIPCKSVCLACSLGGFPIQLCMDGVFGF